MLALSSLSNFQVNQNGQVPVIYSGSGLPVVAINCSMAGTPQQCLRGPSNTQVTAINWYNNQTFANTPFWMSQVTVAPAYSEGGMFMGGGKLHIGGATAWETVTSS